MIYPGDTFGNWGLGDPHMTGLKPSLIPLPAFLALEIVTSFGFCVFLIHRRHLWLPSGLGNGGAFLLTLGLSQAVPMLFTSPTDRYHLAIAAPLVPFLAMAATRSARTTRATAVGLAWAAVAILGGIGLYVAGEYDYQAWQVARDQVARAAFAMVPSDQVEAGYEAMAAYLAMPAVAQTGQLPANMDPYSLKISNPRLELIFGAAGDPRPGVVYHSLATGKIIISEPRR